jgi:hypothetical protein
MAPAAVVASTAIAQVPAQDSVTGSFTTGNDRAEFVFTFDLRSGQSRDRGRPIAGSYARAGRNRDPRRGQRQ